MLIRLIYASHSTERMPMDLHDILAVSTRNNARRGITGALGFLDGVFVQYLEGEAEKVDRLYRHIERDPRHVLPRVLDRSEIPRRLFSRWAMGLLEWDAELLSIFVQYNPGPNIDLYESDPATAGQMFEAIAKSPSWTAVASAESPEPTGFSRF